MKNNFSREIAVTLVLVVLAILLVNPFMLWMPTPVLMGAVAVFAVVFFVFAGIVWREKPGDERDNLHKLAAGRTAFLIGTGILTLGIVVQSITTHAIDPWLVAALTLMIAGKIAARAYRGIMN